MTNKLVTEQVEPTKNDSEPIWNKVIKTMIARNEEGVRKYGTPLQAFNGRNSVIDCLQEGLDMVVYMHQWIDERNAMVMVLKHYAAIDMNAGGEKNSMACDMLKKLGEKLDQP